MKKINRLVPDVPQPVADNGADILERYFNRYGVTRALHLPPHARVELAADIGGFFTVELTPEWVEKQRAREAMMRRQPWAKVVIWFRELVGLE